MYEFATTLKPNQIIRDLLLSGKVKVAIAPATELDETGSLVSNGLPAIRRRY